MKSQLTFMFKIRLFIEMDMMVVNIIVIYSKVNKIILILTIKKENA